MTTLADPLVQIAILQTLRVLTAVTGFLVAVDSFGVLFSVEEYPPHKPKWSATAWLVGSVTVSIAAAYLLSERGRIGDPTFGHKISVWGMYAGLTVAFTCRAISRARRPWFTVLSVFGMSVAGVTFALWGLMK